MNTKEKKKTQSFRNQVKGTRYMKLIKENLKMRRGQVRHICLGPKRLCLLNRAPDHQKTHSKHHFLRNLSHTQKHIIK